MLRSAILALSLAACGAPVAMDADASAAPSWSAAGDRACRPGEMPAPPACPASLAVGASGIVVQHARAVIPLESYIETVLLVPGVDTRELVAAMQRCDLARFPMPRTCVATGTCDGARTVLLAGYVAAVAREVVRVGRCW